MADFYQKRKGEGYKDKARKKRDRPLSGHYNMPDRFLFNPVILFKVQCKMEVAWPLFRYLGSEKGGVKKGAGEK
jgi:hypothetical protein